MEAILMKVFEGLKPFARTLINYVGNGYVYCQISHIPEGKMDEIKKIDKKLTKKYQTDLTQGQRQHRKRKGLCNYKALRFYNLILILKTTGEDELKEDWENILGKEIVFVRLSVVVFRDERGKLTLRIGKTYLREIRHTLDNIISKQKKKEFNEIITLLYNLSRTARYRGIQIQISNILREIKAMQKLHGTNYKIREFFN